MVLWIQIAILSIPTKSQFAKFNTHQTFPLLYGITGKMSTSFCELQEACVTILLCMVTLVGCRSNCLRVERTRNLATSCGREPRWLQQRLRPMEYTALQSYKHRSTYSQVKTKINLDTICKLYIIIKANVPQDSVFYMYYMYIVANMFKRYMYMYCM